MCSFIFSRSKQPVSDESLEKANLLSRHRGPDHTEIFRSTDRWGYHLVFLHNLLDISGNAFRQPVVQEEAGGTLILLFNGEIYNHRLLEGKGGDTGCILPTYLRKGPGFSKELAGEYSLLIYDSVDQRVIIAVDPFLTKPLYSAGSLETGEFGIATCASSLRALHLDGVEMMKPNSECEITLAENECVRRETGPARVFSLAQFKQTYDDWIAAFVRSVELRATHGAQFPSVFLSSGYDSGAICHALNLKNIPYDTFSLLSGENTELLRKRIRINQSASCRKAYTYRGLDEKQVLDLKKDVLEQVEPFSYCHEDQPGVVTALQNDAGAVAANFIAKQSRIKGRFVNLSGSGADEIISDYGFNGRKIYYHSEFGGLFPEQLEGFFPWAKFYGDTQRSYLFKDEYILGRNGLEGRYPFLDSTVVQEFLSLVPELKNRAYKAPLEYFLTQGKYPFEPGIKRGFSPVEDRKPRPTLRSTLLRFWKSNR